MEEDCRVYEYYLFPYVLEMYVNQGVAVSMEYGRATQLLKYSYRMTLDSRR